MSNEAVRFYPLDQWQGMADLPHTRDMSRQMTFPWPAAYKSISLRTSHDPVKHHEIPSTPRRRDKCVNCVRLIDALSHDAVILTRRQFEAR